MNQKELIDLFVKAGKSTWKFFVGGVVVAAAFLANFIDLKQPALSLEIIGIERTTYGVVDITSNPLLRNTAKLLVTPSFLSASTFEARMDVPAMLEGVARVKLQLADRKVNLASLQDKFQKALHEGKLAKSSTGIGQLISRFQQSDDDILKGSETEVTEYINGQKDQIAQLEDLVALSEKEIDDFKSQSEKTEARISIVVAVSNSGDGSTTLKPQAILRTDLGEGNYLDLLLRIRNYESQTSEVKPRSTSILRFDSDEIRQMSPQDQDRFFSFFKNTSPSNLYATDVRGRYYVSNTVPFAQGIYEQKLYDGLKTFASNHGK